MLLQGDVNMHLTNNMVLREFFDLGPVLVVDEEKALSKAEKVERVRKQGTCLATIHMSYFR